LLQGFELSSKTVRFQFKKNHFFLILIFGVFIMSAAITQAISDAQAALGLVGPGLVTLAALMLGVGIIVKSIGK